MTSGVPAFRIPSGIIAIWSGTLATIPAGWKLCDGTIGTPDLRSKFVKGTAAGVDPGATGGSTTHTHSYQPSGTISAHSHTVGDTGHTHTFTGTAMGTHVHSFTSTSTSSPTNISLDAHTSVGLRYTTGLVIQVVLTGPTSHAITDPTHAHTMTGFTSADSAGTPSGTNSTNTTGITIGIAVVTFVGSLGSTSAENHEPPYYEIAFIMKI